MSGEGTRRDAGGVPPGAAGGPGDERESLVVELRERVKELTALHGLARLAHEDALPVSELLLGAARLLPPAFLHPDAAAARVACGDEVATTEGWKGDGPRLAVPFRTVDGRPGAIEVAYVRPVPPRAGGAFLAEEESLLASFAEMLRIAIDRRYVGDRLSEAVAVGRVNVWEWDIPAARVFWPGRAPVAGATPGRPFSLSYEEAMERVHPEDRPIARGALEEALAAPDARFQREYRVLNAAGQVRWVLTRGRLYRDASGRPVRMLGVATDVTERHALEERLRQGEKMAAVGRLAGGIAHDFNNILTAILGGAELALMKIRPEDPARRHVEDVARAGETAAALVRQLLAFSRKRDVRVRPVDLNGTLRETRSILDRVLGAGVELRCDGDEATPRVLGDPQQIQQVILNLAANARDAMAGQGTLSLRVRPRTAAAPTGGAGTVPRAWAVLEVEDTGPGIPPEVRARLFEPFFTTKAEGKGTGFGLSTVYGIVERCGGFVEVESEVGRGACFRVHFPVAPSDAAAPASSAPR